MSACPVTDDGVSPAGSRSSGSVKGRGHRRFRLLDFFTGRADDTQSPPVAHPQQHPQPVVPAADLLRHGPNVFGEHVHLGDSGVSSDVGGRHGPNVFGEHVHGSGSVYADDQARYQADRDLRGDYPADEAYDAVDRNWVRYRPGWSGVPRVTLFVLVVVFSVFWLGSRIHEWIDVQIDPSGPLGPEVEFTVSSGSSLNDIAGDLDAAGVISNATVFRYWLRCGGDVTISGLLDCDSEIPTLAGGGTFNENEMKAGAYTFNENMSFEDVLTVLSAGPAPVAPFVFAKITIPEGLRWTEMADRLVAKNPDFDSGELETAFAAIADEADYLPDSLGGQGSGQSPVMRTAEGLLFPATYDIAPGNIADEHDFLRRLSDEFDKRFSRLLDDPGMPMELAELGLRPYDVVVVASLIEEEALIPDDRPKIARVIYNRLAAGERLGIDATACYAVAKPCAELTSEDIKRQSPWNTRVVRGLPPTPISAPGEASLRAALQPAEGDWMFYVLTDSDGVAGAHHFSTTIEEHLAHVKICRDLGHCR